MNKNYLLLDIGGSFIKYAVSNKQHVFSEKGRIPTPLSLEGLLDEIFKIYSSSKAELMGISVSIPGIIDAKNGVCITGGSLDYNTSQPIGKLISNKCDGICVIIQNDAKCAACAELWQGSLQGCLNAIVIVLGTGVGGSIIANGNIVNGPNFSAGEFSFICTDPSHFGTLSTYMGENCSTKGLANAICTCAEPDGIRALSAVENGEPQAVVEFNKFCRRVAIQLFNLSMAFDPERIAVGGGISQNPIIANSLKKAMADLYSELPEHFLVERLSHPEILPCQFFNDSNLIGALYNFLICKHELI